METWNLKQKSLRNKKTKNKKTHQQLPMGLFKNNNYTIKSSTELVNHFFGNYLSFFESGFY